MNRKFTQFMLCGLLIALTCQSLQAQERELKRLSKPVLMNNHKVLYNQLVTQQKNSKISLAITNGTALNGTVNVVKDNNAAGTKEIIGSIDNEPNATYWYTVSPNGITGNIVLFDKKKAYRMYSEAGNDYTVEVDINDVACVDYPAPAENASTNGRIINGTDGGTTAAAQPEYQSKPDAPTCIMLDFDGETISGTWWYSGGTVTANPSPMITNESQMLDVYRIIVEKYITYNVNVTTSQSVFDSYAVGKKVKCIFTDGVLSAGNGGIAYVNSFGQGQPCWVYISGRNGALAAAHEIGHTLNLVHDGGHRVNADSTVSDWAYSSGFDDWAPIMGTGYGKTIVAFSKGEYLYANNLQLDLNYIKNRLTPKPDDHGNGISTATPVVVEADGKILRSKNFGIINSQTDATPEETNPYPNDKDFFSYTTAVGKRIWWNFYPGAYDPTLKIQVRIFRSDSTLFNTYTSARDLTAQVKDSLPAGTYYFEVDGVGRDNPNVETGYTDYGSIGTYSFEAIADTVRAWNGAETWNRYLPNGSNTINADLMDAVTGISYFNDTIVPRTYPGTTYVTATATNNGVTGFYTTTGTYLDRAGYRFYIPRTDAGTTQATAYSTPAFVYNKNTNNLFMYQGNKAVPNKFSSFSNPSNPTASLEFSIQFDKTASTENASDVVSDSAASYVFSIGANNIGAFAGSLNSSMALATRGGIFTSLNWALDAAGAVTLKYRNSIATNTLSDYAVLPLANNYTFLKTVPVKIKLYCNNSIVDQYYVVNGKQYSVSSQTFDLWAEDTIQIAKGVSNLRKLTGTGVATGNNVGAYAFEAGSIDAAKTEYAKITGIYLKYVSANTTAPAVVLPVTWQSFTAVKKGTTAVLDWATSTEINTKLFEVERSVNGIDFTTIGKTKAAGNSSQTEKYNYIDYSPFNGNNYYRIKQVDLDGNFTYSSTQMLTFFSIAGSFKVYPSFVTNGATTIYAGVDVQKLEVVLVDLLGKVLFTKSIKGVVLGQQLKIPMAGFKPGMYILQLNTEKGKMNTKLVVQ